MVENSSFKPFENLHLSSPNQNSHLAAVNSVQPPVDPVRDPASNYNNYKKVSMAKKTVSEEKLKDKFPLLRAFRPKYTKRENIDKKILRKFKLYLKDRMRNKTLDLENGDKNFWIMFINGNNFPPMKYTDANTEETVEFKSFNSKFLVWLFSKKGAVDYYQQFVQDRAVTVLDTLVTDYKISEKDDISQLENYIKNLSVIFQENSTMMKSKYGDLDPSSYKSYLKYDMPDTHLKKKDR